MATFYGFLPRSINMIFNIVIKWEHYTVHLNKAFFFFTSNVTLEAY